MRGFPKHLNTKHDILNLKDDYPEQTKAAVQRLLEDRIQWLNIGPIAELKTGIEDKTHKIIETEDIKGGAERYQLELKEDPDARLYRLGFTVEEAEKLISEIGG